MNESGKTTTAPTRQAVMVEAVASYTLRNFARELDCVFCELHEIAEVLERGAA